MNPVKRATPRNDRRARWLFLATFVFGWAFFLLPFRFGGKYTVAFDLCVSLIRKRFPGGAAVYTLLLVLAGAVLTGWSRRAQTAGKAGQLISAFRTSRTIAVLRWLGAALAVLYWLKWVPAAAQAAQIDRLIWSTLAVSVAVIIPLGAMVVQLFVSYGGMEFLGVLAEPVMRPLFKLPGRAALDALTSWVGSYSVGLYITRSVYLQGRYSKQHVAILATCFSTVSMGFVGVVAGTLGLLHLFPLILLFYFLCVVLLAAVLVRVPPLSRYPATDLNGNALAEKENAAQGKLFQRAWRAGVAQAASAGPLHVTIPRAFVDGLALAASILGTIVAVGTLAIVAAKFTPIFDYLGRPLAPVLRLLGLPEAERIAPAVLIEVTEMYIPALLVVDAGAPARFFIAVMSVSQLIFFSSLGPMIVDMFRDIPIRWRDLLALFLLRTLLLLPFLAAALRLLRAAGIFS